MFKKKLQSVNKNVRRPGQALEDINNAASIGSADSQPFEDKAEERKERTVDEADADSADDEEATAVHRPAKRRRQQPEQLTTVIAKPTAIGAVSAPPLTDPALVSVTSSRSAHADTSTNSHQHARYAPKQPPTAASTASPAAPSLSLPSAQPPPSVRFGPQRASGYARSISRIDFQPDICKDWMECGSCGYGDSCKFLHDRLDYKQGWQLDKDWDEQQRKKEAQRKDEEDRRAREETVLREAKAEGAKVGLPFACYICRQQFQQPVVTVCGHYFCERCALQRYVKASRCAVCGKETQGSFSVAHDLLKEIAQPVDASEHSDDER